MNNEAKITFRSDIERVNKYGNISVGTGLFALGFFIIGIIGLYLVLSGEMRKSDQLPTLLLSCCVLTISDILFAFYLKSRIKKSMCKMNFVTIDPNEELSFLSGDIYKKNDEVIGFTIMKSDITVIDVIYGSADVGIDGVPVDTNPGFYKKITFNCVKYLAIYTKAGRVYYIGMLPSPETVKNTIMSVMSK